MRRGTSIVHLTILDKQRIQQAQTYILTHLEKELNSTILAREVSLSTHKLKAGFKQLNHVTLHQYILSGRMEKAKNLLLNTDLPIKAIASLAGYSNQKYFLTAFKKFYHQTPGSLRKL